MMNQELRRNLVPVSYSGGVKLLHKMLRGRILLRLCNNMPIIFRFDFYKINVTDFKGKNLKRMKNRSKTIARGLEAEVTLLKLRFNEQFLF